MKNIIIFVIAYYTRPEIGKAKINNIILFLKNYYPNLRCKSHLNNDYDFSKKYFTL